ncbi:hypothetical protein NW762_005156 [Fusarium torreyae]|uniref:Uncharacterized protein n=1 Tax=Fusarium torreyae TaxID=1237075 RepID=A0A9W8S4Z6_9HYPO|nr:hypothetical protein NW762_005156 [Fusarium torreyae]
MKTMKDLFKDDGFVSRAILQVFLAIFMVTNLVAAILTSVTARHFAEKHAAHFDDPTVQERLSWSIYLQWSDDGRRMVRNPAEYLSANSVPILFLAVLFFIAWFGTFLALLVLLTRGQLFRHHAAKYVFRVMAVITSIFLIVFYFGWSWSLSFEFPFDIHWGLGKKAIIAAHINLAIAVFITQLAAALDIPGDPVAGPNSRRPSSRA